MQGRSKEAAGGGGGSGEKQKRTPTEEFSISISSVETKPGKQSKESLKQNNRQNDVFFFFFSTVVDNWHVTVITARYLSKRVVFLSYLILSFPLVEEQSKR